MKQTIPIECPSCDGTGLITSPSLITGSAVQCTTCQGTGQTFITFTPFQGKKIRTDVFRVFIQEPYKYFSPEVLTNFGKTLYFKECSMSYPEWLNKQKESEDPKDKT